MNTTTKGPLVLITVGPTREAIDPVRYISNHSSGKMGYAIASAFLEQGCTVVLVSGPVGLALAHPNLSIIHVQSADEMFAASQPYFQSAQIVVFAAAVADYKPAEIFTYKMKKSASEFELKMVKNVDIACEFGQVKRNDQIAVGFALETNNEEQNAVHKLYKKNFDLIVLNSTQDSGATFGFDTNKITIINKDVVFQSFPLQSKQEAGRDITKAALRLATNHTPIAQHH
ncbi:phosphopantothenoylcysteine decarboxylase / phosphopantothenate--cysteine ligase [Mucilaginibacter lappiensis]|uniref:Phosphopantothenoylcysteine decarboxylase/phosphopantothenate--cysteine ligase n=1 Tax=Mucilaginibacter lappiensis TaxID=354630 RepID=A0ABR6PT66_9SPHI|nr:phosphopantothenoylcysteine decarboxylase [Mucilaginibacter lappiensis]MBB6112155.1 phosphopantothenoylcysteine decarboxylase/phosphopantothenate--cysteine ligase [Mucilaginibacter lappiensis]SIR93590.1 phosphopantothenoylcysteine decarboxylase / phosphopantothenate--cysteine ligase [Mucilaginibacter lappiensis]